MTHLHGPVPLDDDAYVVREFEHRLIQDLQAGHWILLLGPRQHGKTSALIRLRRILFDVGMQVALVDLQKVPPLSAYEDLVTWFTNSVAEGFKISSPDTNTKDLALALEYAVPEGNSPITIIIDEASNIANQEWRNSFFGQIRAISSDRGAASEGDLARRLRFVFAGTFRPERLVAEENSPFNVCERIETTDFDLSMICELAEKNGISAVEKVSTEIFEFVGGQPYLVQRLISQVQGDEESTELESLHEAINNLSLGQSDHISNLFRRVLEDPNLVDFIAKTLLNGSLAMEPGNEDQRYLVILGLLHYVDKRLCFRNLFYKTISSISPQFSGAAAGNSALKAVLFAQPPIRFARVVNPQLYEIAISAQIGAISSYNGGSNRLALAGFGNALEAVLLDFLLRQTAANLAIAETQSKNRSNFHKATDPGTWTLANMMRGARKLAGYQDVDIPDALRNWRNLVHPSVALQNYKPDETYSPEVCAAAGLFEMLLRDIP